MKDWLFWTVLVIVVTTICWYVSGCHTWQGFQQDIGIKKPEPVKAPSPGVQLWNATKKSNWLVTASILGIAAGVFALTNGATKLGITSIASASASLFMSLAVVRFALWMAVFGLMGSFVAALFSILARRKALVEIITGVQDYRNTVGGVPTAIDEDLDRNQSSTTKCIVKTIKNKLKLKGAI
jgi:predicted small secreted protein